MGAPDGYVLNFDAIERLMKAHQPRLNWSSLATKAEVDPKSLRRWRDGGLATTQKIEDLAKALKTEPHVIAIGWMADIVNDKSKVSPDIEDGGVATLTATNVRNSAIKIDAHSLSQEELAIILKTVTIILNRKQSILLDGTREGCVELLVKLTDDEIRTLQDAIKAGALEHLRVIKVEALDRTTDVPPSLMIVKNPPPHLLVVTQHPRKKRKWSLFRKKAKWSVILVSGHPATIAVLNYKHLEEFNALGTVLGQGYGDTSGEFISNYLKAHPGTAISYRVIK